ncbi:regulator of MON1-CCZ1 complex-like isoform X3 [Populus alba x Populus x berolinensis]|uniref:Regulator of MON1-CCZ1 complex-like isoform X3 n=1 Tax=Populus alba x Populus x berolinensis TaxID=444605 RepID=A0AAD6QPM9_9ROSI|nr:regulator of MON1-CCZ1 complex-like isoform X3 [Populus alba x Populus x berolinensis]
MQHHRRLCGTQSLELEVLESDKQKAIKGSGQPRRLSLQGVRYHVIPYLNKVRSKGSLPIYSSKIAVSVVDNVLLIHQVDTKVVILYDIFVDSRAPISAPLPLLFRGFPRSNASSSRSTVKDGESSEANISDSESNIYGDDWTFLIPDLICNAISACSSEVPSVLEFLQHRKLEASKAKQLCLAITHNLILERRPVLLVAKAIEVLIASYSQSLKTGSYLKGIKDNVQFKSVKTNRKVNKEKLSGGAESSSTEVHTSSSHSQHLRPTNSPLNASVSERQESQVTSPAISPNEMYSLVFAPVEEEMVGDSSYFVAIIVEFLRSPENSQIGGSLSSIRLGNFGFSSSVIKMIHVPISASSVKKKVQPNINVLAIQLLACNERYAELSLFIINKVLQPSKEVAMQLLESGRQNSQVRKLALDMLRQLSLHHDYVLQLVQDGYYLEALRYARKHKVVTVRPSLFLEAALASNDSQLLAAVLRFFSDFTPGFITTSDCRTYNKILNEMNSAVAV